MSEGSATRTADSTAASANQPGEIGSHVARSEPTSTHGHQPGKIVGNDAIPESNAKAMPPGTAPASRTFQPNAQSEVNTLTETTGAAETIPGSTSGDVHAGLGHPGAGMSSKEAHHDGGKTHGGGLQGVGAGGVESDGTRRQDRVDMDTDVPGATQKVGGETTGRDEDRRM